MMESIRRMGYLDVEQWNKPFLVDRYFEIDSSGALPRKVPITTNFFAAFRGELLAMNSGDLSSLPANFYWTGEPKFNTYEQAFQFFYQISRLADVPECTLSNALSLSFNRKRINAELEKYLMGKDIRYREYAQAVLKGTAYSTLPDKALIVQSRVIPIISQSSDKITLSSWSGSSRLRKVISDLVTEDETDSEYLHLPGLLRNRTLQIFTTA